ncbi:hypothetical protein P7M11_01710 [Bisgaard Taxon 10/6]|uniref:hypothetical protein n=1 Tax=Exercitatus varius TaxID=67857 RepID=UPI00294B4DCD|nr:hypothetical protein [Exercitatus varius]MDG2953441.1 hypothetical protein [Exercitatus varius]
MKSNSKLNIWLQKISGWGVIILLIFSIIIPLLLKDKPDHTLWSNLFSNIGIALFSALSISKYLQKEALDMIFNEIPFLQKTHQIGINDFPKDGNIGKLDFEKSVLFTVVMNDGKYFLSQNAENLCKRFKNNGLTTTFIMLDSESEAVKMLRSANGKDHDESYYKNKIIESIHELRKYSKQYPEHKFEIYLYPNGYFRTSIVLTDNNAIIGTYRNAPGKRKYPIHMLISKYGDELSAIKEDIEELKNCSKSHHIKQA